MGTTRKPCEGCDGCSLDWRNDHAAAYGPMNAPILVIGEAPGKNEAAQGKPFVGKSGKTIRNTMAAFGIDPEKDVRWLNTAWCRPPANRAPTAHEQYQCAELVDRELALTQAKVILTLGRTAIDRLLGHEVVSRLSKRATWDGYCYPRSLWPEDVKLGHRMLAGAGVYKSGAKKGQPKDVREDLSLPLRISSSVVAIVAAYHPAAIQKTAFKEIQRLRQAVRIAKQVVDGAPIYEGPDMDSGWIFHYPSDWRVWGDGPRHLIVDIENDEFNITRVGLCEVVRGPGWVEMLGGRGSWPWSPALQELLCRLLGPDSPYDTIVGHNLTYDDAWLREAGVEIDQAKCLDTMLMAQIDEPDLLKGLGAMWRYLPPRVPWKYRGEEVAMGSYYNLDDVETTARVFMVLRNRLQKKGQWGLVKVVCQASFTIKRMSISGLGIDRQALEEWLAQQHIELVKLDQEWQELHPGINWNSTKQLQKLFLDLGIIEDSGDVDTGKVSTDKASLEKLSNSLDEPDHVRSIELLRSLRRISKLTATWGRGFIDKLDPDGVLRPNYLPQAKDEGNLGSAAGRLSSSPNVQNIPEEARFAIVSPLPGHVVMYADFSAIENRVMFRLAGDLEMLEKMDQPDYDPHTENLIAGMASLEEFWREAAQKKGVNQKYYQAQLEKHLAYVESGGDIRNHPIVNRRKVKTFLYAYTYGSGDQNIGESLGLKTAEAAALRMGYESAHPIITDWRTKVIEEARSKKCLQNPFGRIRYFWGVVNDGHTRNAAINFLPQSTVADMFWVLFPDIEAEIAPTRARLMTQVHDAFLISCPREGVQEVAGLVSNSMGREWPNIAPGFHVPVSVEVGLNWGDMVSVEEWIDASR